MAKAFLFGPDAEADDFTANADYLEQQQQYEEARKHWGKQGPIGKLQTSLSGSKRLPNGLKHSK